MLPCYITVDSPDGLISPVSLDSCLDLCSTTTTTTTQLSSQLTATATAPAMSMSTSNDNEFAPSWFFPDHTLAPKEAPPLLLP